MDKNNNQGILKKLSNGRFELNGKAVKLGTIIEIFLSEDNEWEQGKVRFKNGVYFISKKIKGKEYCACLNEGSKARFPLD